jgi:hypothetical protein
MVDVRNDEVQTRNLEGHDWTTLGGMMIMIMMIRKMTMCWLGNLAIVLMTKGESRRSPKLGIKH